MIKVCTKCLKEKPVAEFPDEAKRKDGKYPWCRLCLSQHRKDRYVKTPRTYWITHKVCSKCKEWKTRESFEKYKGNNLHYRCIDCEKKELELDFKGLTECSSCKVVKPLSDFYKSRIKKTSKQCSECHKNYSKQSDVRLKRREDSLKKFFGITLEDYKQLLVKQNSTCPICLIKFEENNYSYPVDHAHGGPNEGIIRAILHDRCNRFVMWKHNEPEQLRRAAELIDNPLTTWFVPEEFIKSRKQKNKRRKRRKKN